MQICRATLPTVGLSAARQSPSVVIPVQGRTMSASRHITVPYTDLQQGLDRLLELPAPHYALFVADPDPVSNAISWCPDCVRTVPAVKRALAEGGASLLEVLVGQRPVWKDPLHPLRLDPQLQVHGVPTLVHYTSAGPGGHLGAELEKASSPQATVDLVNTFLSHTRGQ